MKGTSGPRGALLIAVTERRRRRPRWVDDLAFYAFVALLGAVAIGGGVVSFLPGPRP